MTRTSRRRTRNIPKHSLWFSIQRSAWYYLFLLPWVVLVGLFVVYPQIASYPYTLLEGDLFLGAGRFVGLDNFAKVLHDEYFWKAFRNTFLYAVLLVPIQLFLALSLALTLNNPKLRFASFYRAVFFSPVVTNTAIIGIIMGMMFIYLGEAIKPAFVFLGLIQQTDTLNLLGDSRFVVYAVIAVGIWKTLGLNLIYFLAALQAIPKELYEAAKIDGANPRQEFRFITIPGLRETGLIITFLAFLGSLQVFELFQTMVGTGTSALVADAEVVSTYIYRNAFGANPSQGLASAAALTMGLITLLITLLQIFVFRKFGIQRGMGISKIEDVTTIKTL